jgi:selenobiotic family peptide radical SAM maturase
MLTLTKDNMDQVVPLAEMLTGQVDAFNFNRLSPVGEGADLQLPDRKDYTAFLEAYVDAAKRKPHLFLKDNLINVVLHKKGEELFGGCTGYGCGAAFNFIAVLPDGEAHACRKFPSPIGNILKQGIDNVYESEMACRYRRGCSACESCTIRHVCGGCLAIAQGLNLDIFKESDPFCFIK